MSNFPLRVNDRSLANLDDAVAGLESNVSRRLHQFDVSPLVAMVVNVISDLREEDTLWPQNAICLSDKRWECVRKGIAHFLR